MNFISLRYQKRKGINRGGRDMINRGVGTKRGGWKPIKPYKQMQGYKIREKGGGQLGPLIFI